MEITRVGGITPIRGTAIKVVGVVAREVAMGVGATREEAGVVGTRTLVATTSRVTAGAPLATSSTAITVPLLTT